MTDGYKEREKSRQDRIQKAFDKHEEKTKRKVKSDTSDKLRQDLKETPGYHGTPYFTSLPLASGKK